jgi:hypothetical protein
MPCTSTSEGDRRECLPHSSRTDLTNPESWANRRRRFARYPTLVVSASSWSDASCTRNIASLLRQTCAWLDQSGLSKTS